MSERITIETGKLWDLLRDHNIYEEIARKVLSLARKCSVPELPSSPPDDRLDLIFDLCQRLHWNPRRIENQGDPYIVTPHRKLPHLAELRPDWINSDDAAGVAIRYTFFQWKRGAYRLWCADTFRVQWRIQTDKDSFDGPWMAEDRSNEALVRSVLLVMVDRDKKGAAQ